MKKIYLFLLAAAGIFAAASCAREEIVDPSQAQKPNSEAITLTVAFEEGNKTALVDGKTYWVKGDVVRIYNSTGSFYNDVVIPEESDGKKTFDCEVDFKDTTYFAVYPKESAAGVAGGKVKVAIPSDPDGLFASANICAAETKGTTLTMKNVTAILKVNVTSGNVIEFLQIASKNPMVGTYSVAFDGEAPALTAVSGTRSATLAVGGIDGDYFIPIAPGTYQAEFAMTALRGNGGYQTLTATKDNIVKVNTIIDAGTIGGNLKTGLNGEGTEASPYIISNNGELTAFTTSVNLGNHYVDKVVSLTYDVEDAVTTPIGYWLASDDQASFAGTFLGNNHTVNLNLSINKNASKNYVALFGVVDEGATIKDLKLKGTVNTTGNYAAPLAGYLRGSSKSPITIENCESEATVSGGERSAGLIGYATYAEISNCKNNGTVTGLRALGGLLGYGLYANLTSCINNGAVTGTKECGAINKYNAYNTTHWWNFDSASTSNLDSSTFGVGGVAGYVQNTTLTSCTNNAEVKGVSKVGGIAGSAYGGTTSSCVNSANITASGSIAGGIIGWAYTSLTSNGDSNSGDITAKTNVGGLIGFLNAWGYSSSNSTSRVNNGINTGKIQATGKINVTAAGIAQNDYSFAGGCIGMLSPTAMSTSRRGIILVDNLKNTGDVTGVGHAVGGVIGKAWCWSQFSSTNTVSNCSNSGTVTGYCRVGGFIGEQYSRWISQNKILYTNIINTGNVYATIATGTSSVGGIIGRSHYNSTSTVITPGAFGSIFVNAINTGNVYYVADNNTAPYAGGIGGYVGLGAFYNVVNTGKIGPKSGAAAASSELVGAISGQAGTKYYPTQYCYYPTGVADLALGSKSNAEVKAGAITRAYDAEGKFADALTIATVEYAEVVAALNAWIVANTDFGTLSTWKAGPVFDIQ